MYHEWEDEYEYFRYEPIRWIIVNENNGEYELVSEFSLDCQTFDNSGYSTWEESDIRSWLNTTFYDTAFSDEEKKIIKTTIVDNSADSQIFEDAGAPTEDKVYLPDKNLVQFKKVSSEVFTTDYGDTMGTYCNRTSTIADDGKYYAAFFTRSLKSISLIWTPFESRIRESDCDGFAGVRPMITINAAHVNFSTELVISENVTELDVADYSGCNALTKVTLPEGLTEIRKHAFTDCRSLKEINIPSTVISIEKGAFMNCESLEMIQLPEGIKSISSESFANCTSLKSINIPESIENISSSAFVGSGLTEISLPAGLNTQE